MELHQLRYFVTVAREGTFTRAAERLYLTQPSLSEQIRKLEGELGSPLFERLGRSLVLTAAGEAFRPHAERVLHEIEQSRVRIQEVRGLRSGRLTIGVPSSVAARLLPRSLVDFRRRHPAVETVVREDDGGASLEDAVHRGELDLAIVPLPRRRRDLDSRRLVREPLVALVPPRHRLDGLGQVALLDLAEEPFVALRPGHGLRDLLDTSCRRAGFEPTVVFESDGVESAAGMVLAGAGVTVLPRMAVGAEGRRIAVSDPFACRELCVIWRQGQPLAPAASAFLDVLRRLGDAAARG